MFWKPNFSCLTAWRYIAASAAAAFARSLCLIYRTSPQVILAYANNTEQSAIVLDPSESARIMVFRIIDAKAHEINSFLSSWQNDMNKRHCSEYTTLSTQRLSNLSTQSAGNPNKSLDITDKHHDLLSGGFDRMVWSLDRRQCSSP